MPTAMPLLTDDKAIPGMASPAKFLVIGSNSFSGATFCDFLAAAGHNVLATSRSAEAPDALLPYKWQKRLGSVRFKVIDLNKDLDELDGILRRERPSHVVNFAAQSMVGESWINPDHWMMTNVVSTIRLHERLRHLDFLERYIHITTPEVYGSTDGWVREDQPFNPSTPYAVSRAAADMSLHAYFVQYGFPVVSTRAANVYGPGQQLYRIIPRTIIAAMGGQKLRLDGGGKSERVFIHMRDVSDATLKVALYGRPGGCYHISGTELISIRGLVELILEKLGKKFDSCVEIGPERPGKDSAYMLDSSRLRDELGWVDTVPLAVGIDETIAWANRFETARESLPIRYEHKP
jgi:dTDP-glucose 4,6-dehydratase